MQVLDPGLGRTQGSWAAAGVLSSGRPHELPDAVHVLADRSLELWHDLGARHPELEFRRIGAVLLGADPEWTSWRERHGLVSEPVEWQGTSAIRFPEVAVVRSPRCAPALLRDLTVEPARVDDLDALRRQADVVVVAAGAWASPLLAQAGLEMEVAPRRGQMLLFRGGRTPGVLFGAGDDTLAVPRDDGRVVVGTTLEDAGFDASTVPEDLDRLESWARRVVPDLGPREDAWAGFRPYSPRGVPTIGWAAPGVIAATGHFRNGILLAPATGELVADLVMGRPVGVAATALAP